MGSGKFGRLCGLMSVLACTSVQDATGPLDGLWFETGQTAVMGGLCAVVQIDGDTFVRRMQIGYPIGSTEAESIMILTYEGSVTDMGDGEYLMLGYCVAHEGTAAEQDRAEQCNSTSLPYHEWEITCWRIGEELQCDPGFRYVQESMCVEVWTIDDEYADP